MLRGIRKRKIRSMLAAVLAAILFMSVPAPAFAAEKGETVIALGADLNSAQQEAVLSYMQLSWDDLNTHQVFFITNAEEHQWLDPFMSPEIIGDRTLSSSSVKLLGKGSGVHVTTYNVTYCTPEMYESALITAGIEDAEVIIASPEPSSGTAALIGVFKSYAYLTGRELDSEKMQTAIHELIVSAEVGNNIGDSETAEKLIAAAKAQIIKKGVSDPGEISVILSDLAERFGISLDSGSEAILNALLKRISPLRLSISKVLEQGKTLFDKIRDMDLDIDLGSDVAQGILSGIVDFFSGLWARLKEFLHIGE